jgi:hypothetical protein
VAIPSWARPANPPTGLPRVLAPDGNVLAVLFSAPFSPPMPSQSNKILFIVRQARDGKPLTITATRAGRQTVHVTQSAESGPGEIYPTVVDVPSAGCWHLALAWNGHHSSVNVRYYPTVRSTDTTPATSATSTPTTTASTAAPTTCRTADLAFSLSGPIGSAGHFNYELQFRNRGTLACTMTGFPGVSFLDANGHQIGVPAARNSLTYSSVTLEPGATAYAHLAVVDTSVQNCPAAAAHDIRVYPPNETAFATIAVSGLQVCSNQAPGATVDPALGHSLG